MSKATILRTSVRGARAAGQSLSRGGARLQRALIDEMGHFGLAADLTRVFREAAPKGDTRRLERNIKASVFSRGGRIVINVESGARSEAGFPYTQATRTGRKEIRPIRAKALRFTVGGKVIYTRYVRPWRPPSDWVADAVPSAEAAVSVVAGRIGRRIDTSF